MTPRTSQGVVANFPDTAPARLVNGSNRPTRIITTQLKMCLNPLDRTLRTPNANDCFLTQILSTPHISGWAHRSAATLLDSPPHVVVGRRATTRPIQG